MCVCVCVFTHIYIVINNNSFLSTKIMGKTMLFINLNVDWEKASLTIKKNYVTLATPQQNYQRDSLYTNQILAPYVNI